MPSGILGGVISGVTGLIGASSQAKASSKAARIQAEGALQAAELQLEGTREGIDENSRQFDLIQELLQPYNDAGREGVLGQLNIAGYGAEGAQQEAIDNVLNSSEYKENVRVGEEAILANASATGGLRGGDVQSSLSQFRPSILNGLLDKQFSRAGELASRGLGAASGQGNLGAQTANTNSNLLRSGLAGAASNINLGASATAGGVINSSNAFAQGLTDFNSGFQQANAFGGFF